jgi:hypothetical protein
MQPTIVKASQAHDFLALVPQLTGFLPENSMVLVAFRGNRTCGALRFNLPDPQAPERVHKRIATTLIGTLCKIPGVDAVVPVVYTDDGFETTVGMPHQRFAKTLAERAELSGFLLRDSLCVAADGWGSYLDAHCPAGGRPLGEIASSPVPQAIPERREIATLQSGAELPRIDLAVTEKLARVFRRYERLAGDQATRPELIELVGDVLDPVESAEAALLWPVEDLCLEDAAALLFLVQSPPTRDQMMLQFAFGREVGEETYDLNTRYSTIQRLTGRSMDDIVMAERELYEAGERDDPGPSGTGTADIMMGMTRQRPDPVRIERAISLLKVIVAMAPKSARPAPLCMLAWLSWALGRGSIAGIFIDRALKIDRRYSMALLLHTLFGSGHLPEWAYAVPGDR